MRLFDWQKLYKLRELLRETAPTPEQMAQRLKTVERNIVLPVKAIFIGIVCYDFYFLSWMTDLALPRTVAQQTVERFFLIYLTCNCLVAGLLLFGQQLHSTAVQRVIFTSNFLDGLFMSAMIFITGGFDSIVYWMLLALVVRNAMSCPRAEPQIILNFSLGVCYVVAGVLDVLLSQQMEDYDLPTAYVMENPAEPFLLRLFLLWLLAAVVYGVQVLFEKQRQAEEEARESAARQAQVASAGRLAARIAHQLKNPLGIINTAAWSLQRAVSDSQGPAGQQLAIIREEVERSDRIITQLMGYAQLAEGRVEKLDVAQAIQQAIVEAIPPAAEFEIKVVTDVAPNLPPLLMQRAHLNEVLVNLLKNAREAVGRRGVIEIRAYADADSITLMVRDDGPGISRSLVNRIFEPYFTTKEKGSGLGLPLVKQNTEFYGGTVRLETELGKGASFILNYPTKTFMRQKA